MAKAAAFFSMRGDTFSTRKKNCCFVMRKNSLYAERSPSFSVPLPAGGKSLSPLAKQSSPSYKLSCFFYGVVGPLPQVENLTQGRLSLAFYESPARPPFCLLTQKHAVGQSQRRIFLISRNSQHGNLLRDNNNAFQLATQQCCATSCAKMFPVLLEHCLDLILETPEEYPFSPLSI